MKNLVKISIVFVCFGGILFGSGLMQKYDIKQGEIFYSVKSSSINGIEYNTTGQKRVVFDKYGERILTDENITMKHTILDNTTTEHNHLLSYLKESIVYIADFKTKKVQRMQNPAYAMMSAIGESNSSQSLEAMMSMMGGKRVGSEIILGYSCDSWEVLGARQCIYKGIVLKIESQDKDMHHIELAIKIDFDKNISKADFALPDFDIYDMVGNKLDKSRLEQMDIAEAIEVAKSIKSISLTVKDTHNHTKDHQLSPDDMKRGMMESLLPMMKKEIVAQESIMKFGKECLSKADTIKEANACSHKMTDMGGEREDDFVEWNKEMKKEI